MKKIVKTTYVSGCYMMLGEKRHCPFWHDTPNSDWYCMKSHRLIASFPSPMSNIMPYANTIPDWCELEDE